MVGAMPSAEPPTKEAEANQSPENHLGDREHLQQLAVDTDGNIIRKRGRLGANQVAKWKSLGHHGGPDFYELEGPISNSPLDHRKQHAVVPHGFQDHSDAPNAARRSGPSGRFITSANNEGDFMRTRGPHSKIVPRWKFRNKEEATDEKLGKESKSVINAAEFEKAAEEYKNERRGKRCGWFGVRHWMALLLFLGMANAYIMRTNMSVAIVAMVNHTALPKIETEPSDSCDGAYSNHSSKQPDDGEFVWNTKEQSLILSSFFYGYVITQIPFGMLSKRYGAKYFLGVGMLVNSLFGLLVPVSAYGGIWTLIAVRFIQGLGEGPIVPCTHTLLAKWVPPTERSRTGAFVYAGAQFGTIVSMPLSGLLSAYGFAGGWPSIFYVFGMVGVVWSVLFLIFGYEDPESHPQISASERKFITTAVWGDAGQSSPPIPWRSIAGSLPFWAILVAHIGQNYGYETLMTELPTFMKQILHFDIKDNGGLSALPYLAMFIFSNVSSVVADWMISSSRCSVGTTRRIVNTIGQVCPAIALVAASYTGCQKYLTVAILTIGVGFNGGIYSGFKVNHLDISPRFAGVLMSFTNCTANLAGLLAPLAAGWLIHGRPTQEAWREVFFIAAGVYTFCALFYVVFMSGERQPWDNPEKDENRDTEKGRRRKESVKETQQ